MVVASKPIFKASFRIFFLLAAFIAFIYPNLWSGLYLGKFDLSLKVDSLFWHGHEMLFGFSGALIAGFILTASANWTRTIPYSGKPLVLLSGFWLIERLSHFIELAPYLYFILVNLFYPFLIFLLARKIWDFKKHRYQFLSLLLVLTMGKLLYTWGFVFENFVIQSFGKYIAVGILRLLLLLIAGRMLPMFTRNKIKANIVIPEWIQIGSMASLCLLVIPLPESLYIMKALFLALAFSFNAYRFFLWKPLLTIHIPIIGILNIGVLFVILNILQEFTGLFLYKAIISQSGLHTLMLGGLGMIGLGIMTRVSLGHTGNKVEVNKFMFMGYIFLFIAVLMRSIIPVFFREFYILSIPYSNLFFSLAFLIYLINNLPILIRKRLD